MIPFILILCETCGMDWIHQLQNLMSSVFHSTPDRMFPHNTSRDSVKATHFHWFDLPLNKISNYKFEGLKEFWVI